MKVFQSNNTIYIRWFIILSITVFIFSLSYCGSKKEPDVRDFFLNLNDTVGYVGMETCRSCHSNIYDTYIHTGMGQSFGAATPDKSAALYTEHTAVYDPHSNFYYKPFWDGDSLMIMEYRIDGADTVHKLVQHISYIIGSGQHTNSHLIDQNGFLFQAPITFYTQEKRWDMAPGFEDGFNSRFSRIIGLECMTCHNGLPQFDFRSENRFTALPGGIDCERCHGPGELHVREKLAGIVVDTAKEADRTIVNPRRLSIERQMDVCQRCHLQGVAVLNEGKTFLDFKPGFLLRDVMHVFLPQFEGADDKFIMASQAERLRMSPCFQSGRLSCITCHNPHISVEATPADHFNKTCISCHSGKGDSCTAPIGTRLTVNNNCNGCHMPKSGAIDIPHVAITDHFIRKHNLEKQDNLTYEQVEQIAKFVGLKDMTDDNPSSRTMANGYLTFFERFSSERPYLLDSAASYIPAGAEKDTAWFNTLIHYYYLNIKFDSLLALAPLKPVSSIQNEWTAYRIGEANFQTGNVAEAAVYYLRATRLKPLQPDFRNKLGSAYASLNRYEQSEAEFRQVIEHHPQHFSALSNLGFVYFRQHKINEAQGLYYEALRYNPDYIPAMMNLVALHMQLMQYDQARDWLIKILEKEPENRAATELLTQIRNL